MKMKELAQLAGVSSSAVSRYLNGGPLSEEKKARIRQVIEETGYQPDPVAQMLRTKTTDQVGLIIPTLDSDAVARVVSGATATLDAAGYVCLLAESGSKTRKEIDYLKLFQVRQLAGVILMATKMTPELDEVLRSCEIPVVIVGQKFGDMPCIYHDDYGAAYELTRRMIEKGSRRLCYIGVTQQDVAVGQQRRQGVLAALRDSGLDPEELIYREGDFSRKSGMLAMESILEDGIEFDGLICATDMNAIGAVQALNRHGIRIPEQVRVAGMDDNWVGEVISPRLTTTHFYYKTSGIKAAELLCGMIREADEKTPSTQLMLGYEVIVRDSL